MRRAPLITPFLSAALLVAPASVGVAQDSIVPVIERVGTLRDRRLFESSGMAISRSQPGVIWTHNDSGDSAKVYAITQAGELLATYRVQGASAFDWEDIALSVCPDDQAQQCLYIADTGDNSERRRAPTIYTFPEPRLPPVRSLRDTLVTARARGTRLIYPNGPRDVEALAVDTKGNAFIFTKGRVGVIEVYRAPRSAFTRDSARVTPIDTLPIEQHTFGRFVTGAAFSPTGKRLVVRTYTGLYFFRPSSTGRFVTDGPQCWLGAVEPQGEAVDFLDERDVLLTSESISSQLGPVLRVSCDRRPGQS